MTEGAEPDMEYIQTSGVGKVMAQALGNMYRSRPKFPVDFLAKWLDNYCFQRDFERQLKSGEVCREELHKKFLEDLAERRRVEKEQEQKLAKEKQELQDLKDKIRDEVAHETLISEAIPNQIFNRVDLTGVYVGLYAPRRSRESEEADEGGEGEQEIPSYALQYIGGDAESMVSPHLCRNYSRARSSQRVKALLFRYSKKKESRSTILRRTQLHSQSKTRMDAFTCRM